MTNAVSGMTGSFWVCATVDGTYKKLGEVSDLKLKIDAKDIDTSNIDDDGWGSSLAGSRSWEISASNNLVLADEGYVIIMAAIMAGSDIFVKILTSGTPTSSPVGWSGKAGVGGGNLAIAGTNTQQKSDWTIKNRGALADIT